MFKSTKQSEQSTIRNFRILQTEGKRETEYYDFELIGKEE
jgi:hypothetical protein